MSSVFSGTNQGTFVGTGNTVMVPVRAGIDWMMIWNYTAASNTETPGEGVFYYWQLGMAPGTGLQIKKSDGTNVLNMLDLTAGGFTLFDTTVNIPGPAIAVTAVDTGVPPLVHTGNTAGLNDGDIVRMYNITGAQQLGGIDFTVGDITPNTSFQLAYMASIVAGTTGNYRRIPYNPYFYPPTRVITKISQATSAIVTLSVLHQFTVGQVIRFVIPTVTAAAFGMTELNGVQATIIDVGQADGDGVTNTITVDVDTSGFTAFAWPLTGDGGFTPAQVVPVGENTAQAIASGFDILGDAEFNTGEIGMALGAGINGPAGSSTDIIYWVAGKSFSGGM
jgi:hypothetical protein